MISLPQTESLWPEGNSHCLFMLVKFPTCMGQVKFSFAENIRG